MENKKQKPFIPRLLLSLVIYCNVQNWVDRDQTQRTVKPHSVKSGAASQALKIARGDMRGDIWFKILGNLPQVPLLFPPVLW